MKFKANTWPILGLILLPFLVQLPEILGWLVANPMGLYSGLGYNIEPGLISGLSSIDPNIGFTSQALGHRAALDWLSGHIPWWNSYEGVGTPLAGEMQSAAFFPLTLLMVFQNGQLYFHIVLEVLAGISTYFLLRQLKLSKTASLTGGILFEFTGTFALLANAPVNPVPFLPLLLLGIERAFAAAQENKPGGWRLIAVALALSIYAGFPETAYLNGLFGAGWVLIRVFQAKGKERTVFFGKVLLGGFLGLALSAPIIVSFVDFLKYALVGSHNGGFAYAHLPKEYLAMITMPNLFGNINIYSGFDKTNVLATIWANTGGYLGVVLVVFALFGLYGREKRGLRLFCGGWIAVTLFKTFDVKIFTDIINLLPLIKESAFFRYAPPSWELAAIILGCFALDDLRYDKERNKPRFIWHGICSFGLVLTMIFFCARNLIVELAVAPQFLNWAMGSLSLAVLGVVSVIVINTNVSSDKRRIRLLSGVIILSSITPFIITSLANPRSVDINQGGISYLQDHQGFNRFYTLGPIEPNYGSYFGISSINHNDLPVSSAWVEYLEKNLDRYADSISFTGNYRSKPLEPDTTSELRRNLSQYEEVGVKYVVAPAGTNPFAETLEAKVKQSGNQSVALYNGQSVSGEFPDKLIKKGTVTSISVLIGNYNNTADGKLGFNLHMGEQAIYGEASLSNSADNSKLLIHLDQPLVITNDHEKLTFQLTKIGGNKPVALWLGSEPSGENQNITQGTKTFNGMGLNISLAYKVDQVPSLEPVYEDNVMDIYELPHPKPYFEVLNEDAQVQSRSRTELTVNSSSPTQFLRRELYFPGWHATVNGQPVVISPYNGIFQEIPLAAGVSQIKYWYEPPYINYAIVVFGMALVVIASCSVGNILKLGKR